MFVRKVDQNNLEKNDDITLEKFYVNQGNGEGISIEKIDVDFILYTSDLVDCIAILIIDSIFSKYYMIHSDSNYIGGVNGVSLQEGLSTLGIDENEAYSIGLIGGQSDRSLNHKGDFLKNILPNASIIFKKSMVDSAYLLSDGFITKSKHELKQHLGIEKLKLYIP